MQAPVLVFDHITKTAAVLVGPSAERRLADVAAAQRKQLATAGRPKK